MSLGPALIWKMGGDTSDFNKKLAGASKRTGKFKSMLKGVGPALSLGVAIGALSRLTAEFDATAKTARKLGVAPELLQEMRFAAERTGVAQNALDMGLQRFTRRMAEAAQGGGELRGVLEQYDIAVKNADGSTRANVDVLGDLANVIQATTDPAEQLRIAFKAFDSEGAAMVNTLRNGKQGLDDLRKAARDTGNVVGGDTLDKFEKLSDAIGTAKGSIKSFTATVVGGFLTFGERIGQGAAMIVNNLQGIETAFDGDIPAAVDRAAGSIGKITGSVEDLTRKVETLAKIEESKRASAFADLTTRQKITALVEREAEIFNSQVAPNQAGSKAWSEAMLTLEQIRLDLKKENANLAKEETAHAEEQAKATRTALEAEAARRGIKIEELSIAGAIVSNLEIQREINKQIVGTGEYAVVQAAKLARLAKEASAAAWDEYRARSLIVKISTGGDSISDLSTDKLEHTLREQKSELLTSRAADHHSSFSIGTSFITAGIQSFIDRIETELDTRRQFESLSPSHQSLAFNPYEIERLNTVTTPQSDAQQQTSLLQDIRDELELQNARYPPY